VTSADRTINGFETTNTWQAIFGNAPANLSAYLSASNFTGTEFVFEIPNTSQTCSKQFITSTATPTPDATTTTT
jgi:hypothetical protein